MLAVCGLKEPSPVSKENASPESVMSLTANYKADVMTKYNDPVELIAQLGFNFGGLDADIAGIFYHWLNYGWEKLNMGKV